MFLLVIRSISHVLAFSFHASRFTPLAARLLPSPISYYTRGPPHLSPHTFHLYVPNDDALHPPSPTPSLPPSHPSSWACASALPMTTRSSGGGVARIANRSRRFSRRGGRHCSYEGQNGAQVDEHGEGQHAGAKTEEGGAALPGTCGMMDEEERS